MIQQARDREIVRVCYEQQLISLKQVARYFFSGDLAYASRRLKGLEAEGFLKQVRPIANYSGRLYQVTGLGVKLARTISTLEVPQRRTFGLATLEHDLLVTSLRLRLRELWDSAWLPEKILKAAEYRQIPDGVALFRSGRKVALELENSSKGKRRYLSIWKRWVGTETFLVLYVATHPGLAQFLRKLFLVAPKGVALGVVEWESLESGCPKVWTPAGELDLLNRREF